MTITILSLFPSMFSSVLASATLKRAIEKKLLKINLIDIRDFASSKHKTVDDRPYGGGEGMLLKVDVLVSALESVTFPKNVKQKIILLSPQGQKFSDIQASQFSKLDNLILICGRYEGIDARIGKFIDAELSIGDYVLSGGEIAAMAVIDAVARKIKGVLSNQESVNKETFSKNKLKHQQYTRPSNFRGFKVPKILLSGNHQEIANFRSENADKLTFKKRPDLIKKVRNG